MHTEGLKEEKFQWKIQNQKNRYRKMLLRQAAQPETVAPAPETPVVEGASSQIQVPPKLIDQVIGQERAVEVIRKAATQRRACDDDWEPGNRQIDACKGDG